MSVGGGSVSVGGLVGLGVGEGGAVKTCKSFILIPMFMTVIEIHP